MSFSKGTFRIDIDWLACELIEQIPGKVSGRPIVRGTRILPDAILNSYDAGDSVDEIHENYPGLTVPRIPAPDRVCARITRTACCVKSSLTGYWRTRIKLNKHSRVTMFLACSIPL